MKTKIKDPKKVAAGRKGGKVSGGNFKRNRAAASMAGKRSAWARHSGKLEDFPLGLIGEDGKEIPFPDEHATRQKS